MFLCVHRVSWSELPSESMKLLIPIANIYIRGYFPVLTLSYRNITLAVTTTFHS